ncbi:phage terminase small subunit P27 family [Mycobacterium sp. G7A2]|uniref:phage terminase small subunit P27 family n=1 Tax=Mycobacterium sp. G7A2 TaxID=3317307 RepID=UPI0035A90AF4
MGKRGPSAAPAQLRLLKGNGIDKDIAGRPVNTGPKFQRGAPEPPQWLSRPAQEEWDRAVAELEPLDLLKPGDYAALVVHCETWATWLHNMAKVRKEGTTLVHPNGKVYKNPAQTVVETAAAQLRNSCREFGLTPASEQNLVAGPPESVDDRTEDPFSGTG